MPRAALAILLMALPACKQNEASVAPTNAAIDSQLEVINRHTPEDSRASALQTAPDAGKPQTTN